MAIDGPREHSGVVELRACGGRGWTTTGVLRLSFAAVCHARLRVAVHFVEQIRVEEGSYAKHTSQVWQWGFLYREGQTAGMQRGQMTDWEKWVCVGILDDVGGIS